MNLFIYLLPILALGSSFQKPADKLDKDPREYFDFELKNRLKVLLISDQDATKSTVSLSLPLGASDDPKDFPGLSRQLQNIILQDDEKTSDGYTFTEFLSANYGDVISFTEYKQTGYNYQVADWALQKSLNFFANMLARPKFNETIEYGEDRSIEYKAEAYEQYGFFARRAILLDAANQTQESKCRDNTVPLKRGANIRDMLELHYKQHYSSNVMSLVVSGNHSIEALRQMVGLRFSEIADKNLGLNMTFDDPKLGLEILVDPGSDKREVVVQFYIHLTPQLKPQLEYIVSLLQAKGKGSLEEAINSRSLAESVSVSIQFEGEVAIVDLIFSLYEFVQPRKVKLMGVIFAYLNAIKTKGAVRGFALRNKQQPSIAHLIELSSKLSSRFENVLGYSEFDEHLLQEAVSLFNDNFILYDVQHFRGPHSTEPRYGLNYSVSRFEESFLSSAKAEDYNLTLPKDKPLETQEKEYYEPEFVDLANNSIGYIKSLTVDDVTEDSFELELKFDYSPSPKAWECLQILRANLESSFYKALDLHAGICILNSVEVSQMSIFLMVHYCEPIDEFLPLFANVAKDHMLTRESFQLSKKEALSAIHIEESNGFNNPVSSMRFLANPFNRNHTQLVNAIDETNFEEFRGFMQNFSTSTQFNIAVSSTITNEILIGTKTKIENIFGLDPSKIQLNAPHHFSARGNFVQVDANSNLETITTYYLNLYEANEVKSSAMALVTSALFTKRFNLNFKTKEKLGYIANANLLVGDGFGGILCKIVGNQPSIYLESRIEAFVEVFVNKVGKVSEAYLNQTISRLAQEQHILYDDPKQHYYPSYIERFFGMEQNKKIVDFLPKVTKHGLLKFLEARLLKSSYDRLKISLHQNPKSPRSAPYANYTLADCGTLISNASSLPLEAFSFH